LSSLLCLRIRECRLPFAYDGIAAQTTAQSSEVDLPQGEDLRRYAVVDGSRHSGESRFGVGIFDVLQRHPSTGREILQRIPAAPRDLELAGTKFGRAQGVAHLLQVEDSLIRKIDDWMVEIL